MRAMKLVMTLVVRDEADIIATNLEYHLAQGVDFVLVTDHGSEDGTSEILREYERMGVAKVIRDDEEGHHQGRRVTRMSELARTAHGADWVINNDADEFWWPLVGDLRDVFSSFPPEFGQITVQRRNFRPPSSGVAPFYSRTVHREASSFNPPGECLEPKVAHRPRPGVVVAPGNHSIRASDLAAVPPSELLEILHFPMRSYEQFERKVIQTGEGYEKVHDRSPLTGRDQLYLLELHRTGALREYYDGLVLDATALERGLEAGSIVIDRRLDHFMEDLHSGGRSRTRPDAPFAGILLRRLTDTLAEAAESRDELVGLRSEWMNERERAERHAHEVAELSADRERASREVAGLTKEVAGLTEALERAAHELDTARRALNVLSASKLMRYTRWARELYYSAAKKQLSPGE
jgi:hypothetical protein